MRILEYKSRYLRHVRANKKREVNFLLRSNNFRSIRMSRISTRMINLIIRDHLSFRIDDKRCREREREKEGVGREWLKKALSGFHGDEMQEIE